MPASNKSKSKSKSISIRIIITDILVNYKIQPGLLSANSSIDQVLKKIGDKMRKVFLALLSLMFTSLMAVTPPALGQAKDFPNRAIKIIVPFTAGSGSDTSARFFGEKMSGLLGQTVVVENRPGASGVIAVSTVKSAPADGHTILLGSISLMSVNPVTMKDLPYDPAKDLKPIAGLARAMAAIIVPQNSKLVTLADVVKASKDDKKSLSAGTYSAGYQLIFEWFANLAGIKFNHIPYKGGAAIYADLVGNQLDIAIVDVGGAASLIKSGKLRAIAMSGETRHPMFPEVPTVKESGFPEYVTYTWTAFSVRSETPDDITAKLADTMQKALATNDAKEYGRSTGGELMPYGPADMQKFQREELDRFRRIATIAGVKPQ